MSTYSFQEFLTLFEEQQKQDKIEKLAEVHTSISQDFFSTLQTDLEFNIINSSKFDTVFSTLIPLQDREDAILVGNLVLSDISKELNKKGFDFQTSLKITSDELSLEVIVFLNKD